MEWFSDILHPHLRDILGAKSRSMGSTSQKPADKFRNNGKIVWSCHCWPLQKCIKSWFSTGLLISFALFKVGFSLLPFPLVHWMMSMKDNVLSLLLFLPWGLFIIWNEILKKKTQCVYWIESFWDSNFRNFIFLIIS